MPVESAKTDPFSGLREQLSRADRVLGFARKLKHDSGSVPPGLSADFAQARASLEREFVIVHDRLPEKIRERLKEFLLRTRNLSNAGVDQNLEKLARRARSLLNELVIDGHPIAVTEEHFADDLLTSPPSKREDAGKPVDLALAAPAPMNPRPLWIGLAVVGALAVVTLVIVLSGVLAPAPVPNIVANTDANHPPPPRDLPPGKDHTRPPPPFDAKGAGYGAKLAVQPLVLLIEPLELEPGQLRPEDLPALQMGLEHLVAVAEPQRVRMAPEQTSEALRGFAAAVVENERKWIADRQPLLESVVGHALKSLQVGVYPRGEQVLVSDFLADKGAPRATAMLALATLGRTAGCPFEVIAPTSPEFPMLAIQLPSGTATYDGEVFAQRPLPEYALPLARLVAAQAELLRPGLALPGARAVISAVLLRCYGALTAAQCRQALADVHEGFFAEPPRDDTLQARQARLFKRAATMLLRPMAQALLGHDSGADAAEALRIYRLAAAARDDAVSQQALLEVGRRAAKGALLDGKPVMLVVGDLMRAKGDHEAARSYYKRALEEFPDDAAAALRLAEYAQNEDEKLALLREAYARGERGLAFLRDLARLLNARGEGLAALTVLDEICARKDCLLDDVLAQAGACIALDKPDWALTRLAAAERFKDEAAVRRLDLILELAVNGASERARRLARDFPRNNDPFVANLLKRYGVE